MKLANLSLTAVRWLVILALAVVACVPALPVLAQDDVTGADIEDELTGMRAPIRFTGVITAIPATRADPWTIGGETVLTTPLTRFLLSRGPAEVGQWADVTARRMTDGILLASRIVVRPPEVQIKGPISRKPSTPDATGAWIIAGQTISVTAETRLNTRFGPLDVGAWAQVAALEAPAGKLTAVRMATIEALPAIEVTGAIQAHNATRWTLSSIQVGINADTLISGAPRVGLIAHAAATRQPSGALLGLRLQVMWVEPGGGPEPVELTGLIEALPEYGLIGLWTVAGQPVMVTPASAVNQEKGLAVVGARVKVVGWQAGEKLLATEVTVLTSPIPGGQYVRFAGRIESLPAGGLIGLWTISEQQVRVTDRTRLAGEANAEVGAFVYGEGFLQATGVIDAVWVHIQPARPMDDGMQQ